MSTNKNTLHEVSLKDLISDGVGKWNSWRISFSKLKTILVPDLMFSINGESLNQEFINDAKYIHAYPIVTEDNNVELVLVSSTNDTVNNFVTCSPELYKTIEPATFKKPKEKFGEGSIPQATAVRRIDRWSNDEVLDKWIQLKSAKLPSDIFLAFVIPIDDFHTVPVIDFYMAFRNNVPANGEYVVDLILIDDSTGSPIKHCFDMVRSIPPFGQATPLPASDPTKYKEFGILNALGIAKPLV